MAAALTVVVEEALPAFGSDLHAARARSNATQSHGPSRRQNIFASGSPPRSIGLDLAFVAGVFFTRGNLHRDHRRTPLAGGCDATTRLIWAMKLSALGSLL